MLKHTV
jgi:hypothetical protein